MKSFIALCTELNTTLLLIVATWQFYVIKNSRTNSIQDSAHTVSVNIFKDIALIKNLQLAAFNLK